MGSLTKPITGIIVHRTLVSSGNLTLILCYENKLLQEGHALTLDKEAF